MVGVVALVPQKWFLLLKLVEVCCLFDGGICTAESVSTPNALRSLRLQSQELGIYVLEGRQASSP